jgi:hypothetical protein
MQTLLKFQKRTSKKKLVEEMKISHQTLFNYLSFCNFFDDFVSDYTNEYGIYSTRIGLTDYQVWVVKSIKSLSGFGVSRRDMLSNHEYKKMVNETISKSTYQQVVNN